MKIADIDYYGLYGNSWLNRLPALSKVLTSLFVVFLVVTIKQYQFFLVLYLLLICIIIFSKLPTKEMIKTSLYPLLFLIFFLVSFNNLTLDFFLLLLFRVLCASTMFVILIFSTPFVEIFITLNKFLPGFLVNIIFLTYRSFFILLKTLENIQLSMFIRGKPNLKRPVYSLKLISNALGHLVIQAIESSESSYEALNLRGYTGSLHLVSKKKNL